MADIVVFIVFMTFVMVLALGWFYHVLKQVVGIANGQSQPLLSTT
jgi:hypothetical protein